MPAMSWHRTLLRQLNTLSPWASVTELYVRALSHDGGIHLASHLLCAPSLLLESHIPRQPFLLARVVCICHLGVSPRIAPGTASWPLIATDAALWTLPYLILDKFGLPCHLAVALFLAHCFNQASGHLFNRVWRTLVLPFISLLRYRSSCAPVLSKRLTTKPWIDAPRKSTNVLPA